MISTQAPKNRALKSAATVIVLLVALLARILRAATEPTINPDLIRFINQGKLLFADPLKALRGETYHPLHSLLMRIVHDLVTCHLVADDRFAWIAAGKVVGVLAGTAVAWLIIRLSRHFGAPWWAAAGAGLLWALGRRTSTYGADGLSDTLFLLLFGSAILVAMRARFRPGFRHWAAVGALSGLAYLTRPEGAAVILILGITLVVMALRHGVRAGSAAIGNRRFSPLGSVAFMLVGFAVLALPYMITIGRFTGKKDITVTAWAVSEAGSPPDNIAAGLPLAQMQVLIPPTETLSILTKEIWETFGFAPCLIVVLAMLLKPRLWGRPYWRPLASVWIVLWLAVMIWLIHQTRTAEQPAGYLDGRHTLVLELMLHCLFALALDIWQRPMRWWQNWWRRKAIWPRLPAWQRYHGWPLIFAGIVLVLGCLPGAIMLHEPPAEDRRYYRDAAVWIQANTRADTLIAFREPTLSFYANRQYAEWFGKSTESALEFLHHTVPQQHLIVGCIFQLERGEAPPAMLWNYRRVVTFDSPTSLHHDVLGLYVPAESDAVPGAMKNP